jgi:DNA-binding MarR family transcriptional regulator
MDNVKELSLVELFDLAWRRIRDELAADPVTEAPELRPSQLRVLGRTPLEGIRVTALAERTQMTAQALGTIVDVLVLSGYLERVRDPHDRRAKLLRPTEAGRLVHAIARGKLANLEDRWRQELGDRQWRELRSALAVLSPLGQDVPPAAR